MADYRQLTSFQQRNMKLEMMVIQAKPGKELCELIQREREEWKTFSRRICITLPFGLMKKANGISPEGILRTPIEETSKVNRRAQRFTRNHWKFLRDSRSSVFFSPSNFPRNRRDKLRNLYLLLSLMFILRISRSGSTKKRLTRSKEKRFSFQSSSSQSALTKQIPAGGQLVE